MFLKRWKLIVINFKCNFRMLITSLRSDIPVVYIRPLWHPRTPTSQDPAPRATTAAFYVFSKQMHRRLLLFDSIWSALLTFIKQINKYIVNVRRKNLPWRVSTAKPQTSHTLHSHSVQGKLTLRDLATTFALNAIVTHFVNFRVTLCKMYIFYAPQTIIWQIWHFFGKKRLLGSFAQKKI
jgi:hypothetical protein